MDAIQLLGPGDKSALDFGCGAGSETRFLLEQGFSVTAVDGNKEAEGYIIKLLHQDRVRFMCSDFETFQFGSYDLVNSSRSLPFIHKNSFKNVMQRLKNSINVGGIFVGQLYGVNDQWNKSGETMTFLGRQQVEELFVGMDLIKLNEQEENGTIANGSLKHWHVFNIIAKKS